MGERGRSAFLAGLRAEPLLQPLARADRRAGGAITARNLRRPLRRCDEPVAAGRGTAAGPLAPASAMTEDARRSVRSMIPFDPCSTRFNPVRSRTISPAPWHWSRSAVGSSTQRRGAARGERRGDPGQARPGLHPRPGGVSRQASQGRRPRPGLRGALQQGDRARLVRRDRGAGPAVPEDRSRRAGQGAGPDHPDDGPRPGRPVTTTPWRGSAN